MGKKIPEIKVVPLVVPQSAKPLHAPVIKVSCGIGDTDGFPAFDVDSDAFATPNDPKWGFQITGGSEFHMPITVFQVINNLYVCRLCTARQLSEIIVCHQLVQYNGEASCAK